MQLQLQLHSVPAEKLNKAAPTPAAASTLPSPTSEPLVVSSLPSSPTLATTTTAATTTTTAATTTTTAATVVRTTPIRNLSFSKTGFVKPQIEQQSVKSLPAALDAAQGTSSSAALTGQPSCAPIPAAIQGVRTSPSFVNFKTTIGAEETTTAISTATCVSSSNKMEHSYTRDSSRPVNEMANGLAPARTILVRRAAQCPSCYTHPLEEQDQKDSNQVPLPSYNEIAAKEAMNECARIAKYVKNINPEDEDWESRVNQLGWSNTQKLLYSKVVTILDSDQLGRLANEGRQHEPIQRRIVVDKSAARMRKALSTVAWDPRLTQWLHCLLMDYLPSTYMASYLDILQTLQTKLPTLMDKMLFGRPLNVSQELLAPVMKQKWEPIVNTSPRTLSQNAVIVIVPSIPTSRPIPNRLQKWYQHLATITQIEHVPLPSGSILRMPLHQIAEQIVSLTRFKLQEMRSENSTRSIILVGFNAAAALALQVAMSETVACVVCMGFAYNTLIGRRGAPDDRMLDIKVPILFVIGQNSARTSTEEVESLREKMHSESSLVVVGCADDLLRVPKSRRKIESVTQSMVDTMVVDEVFGFIKNTLANPPGPRTPLINGGVVHAKVFKASAGGGTAAGAELAGGKTPSIRKRKQDATAADQDQHTPVKSKYVPHNKVKPSETSNPETVHIKRKVGRPRTRPLPNAANATAAVTKGRQVLGVTTASKAVASGGAGKLLANQQQLLLNQKKTPTSTTAPTTTPLSTKEFSNADLNMAIQSLINDKKSEGVRSTDTTPPKVFTNFELVPQSKASSSLKTGMLNPLQKQTMLAGTSMGGHQQHVGAAAGTATAATSPLGTKIKMIPANKFIQLKPPMQSQSKIYTIKTTSMINAGGTGTGGGIGTGVSNIGSNIGSIVATGVHHTQTTSGSAVPPSAALTAAGQQQIFTLKSPNGQTTQFVTAAPAAAPQKYTVVKNANGGTMLQLTTNKSAVSVAGSALVGPAAGGGGSGGGVLGSQLDLSNIIDMPIVFADKDGNLTDAVTQNANAEAAQKLPLHTSPATYKAGASSKSGVGQLIISQKIIKEAGISPAAASQSGATGIASKPMGGTYVINRPGVGTIVTQTALGAAKPAGQTSVPVPVSVSALNKSNKVIYINRNTMKPCTSILSRPSMGSPMPKYTNVVVTNPKTSATTLVPRPVGTASANSSVSIGTSMLSNVNLQSLKSGILNVTNAAGKSLPQIQIINSAGGTASGSGSGGGGGSGGGSGFGGNNASGAALSTLNDKPQIRNIVVKPAGMKQFPTQLFNRNLTVRKLVNIVPISKTTPTTAIMTPAATATAAAGASSKQMAPVTVSSLLSGDTPSTGEPAACTVTGIQSSPKIITLNPVNPSAQPASAAVATTAATKID